MKQLLALPIVLLSILLIVSASACSSSPQVVITYCSSGCQTSWLGDGTCQSACNNAACYYDNGDCGSTPTPNQEVITQGPGTPQATLSVASNVYAQSDGTGVTSISFQLSSVLTDEDIDLSKCIVNYQDDDVVDLNIGTLVTGLTGLLSPNGVVEVTIDVSGYALGVYDTFTIEIIPPTDATTQIRRTLPGDIEPVMNLY